MKNRSIPKIQFSYNANEIKKALLARNKQAVCLSMVSRVSTCILLLFAVVMIIFSNPESIKEIISVYPYEDIPFSSPDADRSESESALSENNPTSLAVVNYEEFCRRCEKKMDDAGTLIRCPIATSKRHYTDCRLMNQTLLSNAQSMLQAVHVLGSRFENTLYRFQYALGLIRGLQ